MSVAARALKILLVAGSSTSTIAVAQTAPVPLTAPAEQTIDGNGVDLATGKLRAVFAKIAIGNPADGGIALSQSIDVPNSLEGGIACDGSVCKVTIGSTAEQFTVSGSNYTPVEQNGSTLTLSGTNYTYRRADGTIANFSTFYGKVYNQISTGGPTQNQQYQNPPAAYAGITLLQMPDGNSLSYYYTEVDRRPSTMYAPLFRIRRIQSIASNAGYRLTYTYESDDSSNIFGSNREMFKWSNRVRATLWNSRTDNCIIGAYSCAVNDRPYLMFAGGTNNDYSQVVPTSVTDAEGKVTAISVSSSAVTIQPPGGVSPLSYTLDGNGRVSQASVGGVTTSYGYPSDGSYRVTTRTTPAGTETYRFGPNDLLIRQFVDMSGATTTYGYTPSLQLETITAPDGNSVKYTRDGRGNATTTTYYPKPNTPEQPITTTAGYEASCPASIAARCNQPNWVKDGRSNQTDYTYDDSTGLVKTVLRPAPSAGASRPKTTYAYTSVDGVTRLTGMTICLTATDCPGSGNERRVTLSYGTRAGNNIALQSVTVAAGDNSVSTTQSFTYTPLGDVDTVDGPLPGSGDTSRTLYDLAMRRVRGRIAPDPDGGGAAKPVAARLSYDSAGRLQRTEVGTVDGQADGQWSSFQPSLAQESVYDSYGRIIQSKTSGGGAAASLVETSYDNAGRVECVAQRMNAGALTAAPSSACGAGTPGADGPDRITRTAYDAANRRTEVTSGYGTAAASTEVSVLTASGKPAWVRDGELNRTTYIYDGHDRLSQTRYPVATKGADTSSTSDYEALSYDAGSNVITRLLRGGQSIGYGYDALNRMASKALPGGEGTIAYSYNLIDSLTRAARSSDGVTLTLGYDALGRLTSDSQAFGTMSYSYDQAGRRTRATWWDGFYVTYAYADNGALKTILENGSGLLASYAYDDLGRRTGITRGNGTTTSYGYDPASRLNKLTQDLAGTGSDLILGFGYNPAGQIASRSVSNDGYAWGGAYNIDRSYGANGLNQLTNAGSVGLGYDARGNLTTSGSTSYGYWSENQLRNSNTGVSLYYDPVGRLHEYDTNVSTRMVYDGGNIAAEIRDGVIARRYVYGPGQDEPILWYEGSGRGDRRWLHADERGSVIAVSDGGGNAIAINSYDAFGIPGAGNVGRFQYTGQAWLPELGLAYYKARMYSPTLGRFMQTDPIGYGDGLNWYNYVGSDPVNATDPSGLSSGYCRPGFFQKTDHGHAITLASGEIDYQLKIQCGWFFGSGYTPANSVPAGGSPNPSPPAAPNLPQNKQCYGPPAAPGTGSTPDELAAQARNNAAQASSQYWNPLNIFWFRSQVRNKGPWDYKQYNRGYQDFGNYNYGRTGAAMGLATDFLLGQAGRAQQAAGTSRPEWGSPGFLGFGGLGGTGSYGDDPRDQEMIRRGISDQRNGC